MEINEYQQRAMSTCMDTSKNFSYMFLNLVGEVGEFAGKVAKAMRKGKVQIRMGDIYDGGFYDQDLSVLECALDRDEFEEGLKKEAGDIMWQLSGLCSVMGWNLEDIAQMNLDKLQERKTNGTIDGSGDGNSREERLK